MSQHLMTQAQVSKSKQGQLAVEAQLLLKTTQRCIESIRKLGAMYLEEYQSVKNKNNDNGDNDDDDNGDNGDTEMKTKANKVSNRKQDKQSDKKIFDQQMTVGAFLNCLLMKMLDPSILQNDHAQELSMIEFGKFKKDFEAANAPQVIMDKLKPFVDTMHLTLKDAKQSIVIPGPKLTRLLSNYVNCVLL